MPRMISETAQKIKIFLRRIYNNNADLCYAVEVNVSEWQENDTWKDSVTVNVGNVALLPEPTVLALLALGVAGVALRRRAA